jgi:thiamine monophosphate synthase
MSKRILDYSLYLVTGRDLLPAGKVRPSQLKPGRANFAGLLRVTGGGVFTNAVYELPADPKSLKGGVTLVQVREKEVDTGEVCLPPSANEILR